MHITASLEYPNLSLEALDPDSLLAAAKNGALPPGQYALAWRDDERCLLVRDPIGCNKLFYGRIGTDRLVVANRIERLLTEGVSVADVFSCPPGSVIAIDKAGAESLGGYDLASEEPQPVADFDLSSFQQEIACEIDSTFQWLASTFEGNRFVVCLSGGMDSTIIASFAKRFMPDATAAVFSYITNEDAESFHAGGDFDGMSSLSDDFRHGVEVADILGLEVLPVFRPTGSVAASVPKAIRLCQDWRDFNVHCANVNLFIAESIRDAFADDSVVVMTGDLMNEYVCDYHAEEIDGQVYYPQPRIPFVKRRRFFVRGLDAGDREVGVFASFGLTLVQPFAWLARHYIAVPPEFVEGDDGKWRLNGPLLSDEVAGAVNRAKCRAQVGGKDGGTLALYHHLKLDQDALFGIWAREMGLNTDDPAVSGLIQFGRYRQDVERTA